MLHSDDTFARSIARQFGITTTFSTSALAAPAFAGLSRFPGSRGRIAFGDDEYNIGERLQGEHPMPPPAEHCIALGVWREGRFLHIDGFDEMVPFDRLLFVVPLSQFRGPKAAVATNEHVRSEISLVRRSAYVATRSTAPRPHRFGRRRKSG
ncbi:MAG: hypothetical protein NVS2B17_03240 [Candidatus Velthaea sp.]